MSKDEILNFFSDINYAYNDSTRLDTLSRMLDELVEQPASLWHRVEEPPKYTGRYVVWCGVNWYGEGMHDEFMTANYNTVSGRWSVDCDKTIRGPLIGDITYWRPIEPPKEDA